MVKLCGVDSVSEHCILSTGTDLAIPGYTERLKNAYDTAMAKGVWNNTYTARNMLEYFVRKQLHFVIDVIILVRSD